MLALPKSHIRRIEHCGWNASFGPSQPRALQRDSPIGTVQTNPGITFPIEDGKFSPTAEVLTSLGSKAGQPMQRRSFDL